MHEMSICESLFSIIEQQAVAQSFSKVKLVRLEIGALAGVELEAMRFSFDALTRDGIAAGAKLDLIEVPAAGKCLTCGKEVVVQQRYECCQNCGEFQIEITGGKELRIKELEVE